MTTDLLSHDIVEPTESAQATVIWIHGLGGQGKNFRPMLSQLKLDKPVRFLLPNASKIAITMKNHEIMPAWYNVSEISGHQRHINMDVFNQSVSQLNALLAAEQQKRPSHQIILAGFSQGGAMALHLGLTAKDKLAGIIAISTYLPTVTDIVYNLEHKIPVCCMHGSRDDIVPPSLGKQAHDFLKLHGFLTVWYEYDTGHMMNSQQLTDISNWINQVLG